MPYASESVVRRSLVAALLSLSCGAVALAADLVVTPTIDFNRDVRTILSDNCFKGHGFDRDWALALIKRALAALESEMTAAGKAPQFHALQPWLDGGSPGASKDAAETLGLTENAFNVAVHRMRQRFRHLVRAEVEATTTSPAEADEEFRHLLNVLTAK